MTTTLSEPERALLRAARAARRRAYAPYSRYPVGAALRARDGRVFSGCNVENASYGLTICAERVALGAAVAAGARAFEAVAVAAGGGSPPWPCGACRQALAEFMDDDGIVLVVPAEKGSRPERVRLGDLLPRAFRLEKDRP